MVAWDHTEGPDGLELVPDLALKLPVPADDGRTYGFRLRPAIRYSDGRSGHEGRGGPPICREKIASLHIVCENLAFARPQ